MSYRIDLIAEPWKGPRRCGVFLRLELKEISHRTNGTELPAKADA
jgi:hypothetical protein